MTILTYLPWYSGLRLQRTRMFSRPGSLWLLCSIFYMEIGLTGNGKPLSTLDAPITGPDRTGLVQHIISRRIVQTASCLHPNTEEGTPHGRNLGTSKKLATFKTVQRHVCNHSKLEIKQMYFRTYASSTGKFSVYGLSQVLKLKRSEGSREFWFAVFRVGVELRIRRNSPPRQVIYRGDPCSTRADRIIGDSRFEI